MGMKTDPVLPEHTAAGLLQLDLGLPVDLPYRVVRGQQEGPLLVISAGVHGAEYASIEAALRLAQLDPAELKGTLWIFPVLNPPSFFARSIYVNPIDGKNLNRVFPGRSDGSFSEQLADWFTREVLSRADAYIDLHGGDLIEALEPFVLVQSTPASRQMAEHFGLPYALTGWGEGTTLSAAAACGVPAVLAEAGGQGLWPPEAVRLLIEGSRRVMQGLGMLPGEPQPPRVTWLGSFVWLRSTRRAFWRLKAQVGSHLEAGALLGVLEDFATGEVEEISSPVRGVLLFAVSSLAMNPGDPLVGIGTA